jgi:type II secretory pathway component PulC
MPAKPNILALVGAIAFAVAVSPALAQSTNGPLSVLPPIDALSETIERPLFREDRRPPTVEEEQQEAADVESGLFTLVGIIVSPKQRLALVKVRGSQDVLQLSEGQQANGWTVLQISADEVIFESNDKTETIELIDIKPAPTRRPSARDRRRQAQQPAQQQAQPQPGEAPQK